MFLVGLNAEVMEKNRILTEDFTNLYLELEQEGLFKPSYTHIFLRIIEVIIMGLVGYRLLWFQNHFAKIIGIVLIGLTQGRCGWLQHECGHNSFSGNPKIDRLFHIIFIGMISSPFKNTLRFESILCLGLKNHLFFKLKIGLGMGFSSTWWSRQHNRHHAMPQRLQYDVDLNTTPLIAYNAKVVKNSKVGKGFMIQNQVSLGYEFNSDILCCTMLNYNRPIYSC